MQNCSLISLLRPNPRYLSTLSAVRTFACMCVLSDRTHTDTTLTLGGRSIMPLWSLGSHSFLCHPRSPKLETEKRAKTTAKRKRNKKETNPRRQNQKTQTAKLAEPRRVSSRTPIPKSSTFVCEARSVKEKQPKSVKRQDSGRVDVPLSSPCQVASRERTPTSHQKKPKGRSSVLSFVHCC